MKSINVGGRRYTDPDVISLVQATGQLIDPRSAVLNQARKLNVEYRVLGGDGCNPLERLKILASLRGLGVAEMDRRHSSRGHRDAVLVPTGKRGQILYNPIRPPGRVAFSIAHEISHTFFPNSISGARFRTLCHPDSREANELERLCDLGASELLMPLAEFRNVVGQDFGLHAVERAMTVFGSSYESTVFRLATSYSGLAAAGLLTYRLRKSEERAIAAMQTQRSLLAKPGQPPEETPLPKYRRQSFYMSEACGDEHTVRWNKSFDLSSCVYEAGRETEIQRGLEALPNDAGVVGHLEAIRAPYQRETADPIHGDVLFLWWV